MLTHFLEVLEAVSIEGSAWIFNAVRAENTPSKRVRGDSEQALISALPSDQAAGRFLRI